MKSTAGCEAKDAQKRKLNRCTSQVTYGEKTIKEVLVLDVGGKPQRTRGKPARPDRHRTPNPCGAHSWMRTGVLELEGEERIHFANLTVEHFRSHVH